MPPLCRFVYVEQTVRSRHKMETRVAGFQYLQGRGIVPNTLAAPFDQSEPERLRGHVGFTGLPTTPVALTRAVELAGDLSAEIRVIVPHVVPYPLVLDCPVT